MLIEIVGKNMPGRRCGPNPQGEMYENIHVGTRNGREVVDLVPGDAPSARWLIDVVTKDSGTDFGGPFVHGRPGDRFMYLSWGTVGDNADFSLFRAAKVGLSDIDPALIRKEIQLGSRLVCTVAMTDAKGHPRCARVRPPDLAWSAADQR